MNWLAVDPIRCTGHGLRAELLPETLTLDEWGFPLLTDGTVPPDLLRRARRKAATCLTRSLRLQRALAPSPPVSAETPAPGLLASC